MFSTNLVSSLSPRVSWIEFCLLRLAFLSLYGTEKLCFSLSLPPFETCRRHLSHGVLENPLFVPPLTHLFNNPLPKFVHVVITPYHEFCSDNYFSLEYWKCIFAMIKTPMLSLTYEKNYKQSHRNDTGGYDSRVCARGFPYSQ